MWRLSEQKCIYLFTFDKLDREFAQVQHQLTQPQTTEGTARLTAAELSHKWGEAKPLVRPTWAWTCAGSTLLCSLLASHIYPRWQCHFVYSIVVAHVSRANDLQMPRQVCFWDEELTGCETQLDWLAWRKVCMRFKAQCEWLQLEPMLKTSCLKFVERFTCSKVRLQVLPKNVWYREDKWCWRCWLRAAFQEPKTVLTLMTEKLNRHEWSGSPEVR